MEMSRLPRDGTAKPVSRDQILRRVRGQGNIYFPCSANHEQDWQPYPVDPYSCYMCDHTLDYESHLQPIPTVVMPTCSSVVGKYSDVASLSGLDRGQDAALLVQTRGNYVVVLLA